VAASSLARRFPAVARFWHPRKNGEIRPEGIGPYSKQRVWWMCPKGLDHEWQESPARVMAQSGACPYCANRKACRANSLGGLHPNLAAEWHPTKNGTLRPDDVVAGSHKKVWWKCPRGPDHEWKAYCYSRTHRGRGCPFCTGNIVGASNSLAALRPDLARSWHPTKNGTLRPDRVFVRFSKPVWWLCNGSHAFRRAPVDRARRPDCPYCAGLLATPETSLARVAPAVARQWHPTKNGTLRPRELLPKSSRKVWWKCPAARDHEWQATVADRTSGRGCPFCAGRRVVASNSLARIRPDIARTWHPTKNGTLKPRDVTRGSEKLVWWKCPAAPDHEWEVRVLDRVRRSRCPFCSGWRVCQSNSLARVRPDLARTWHPTKNGTVTPADVFVKSYTRYWWRCDRGHTYRMTPAERPVRRCPYCSHRLLSPEFSLAELAPALAKEWHPAKNGALTARDVPLNSHRSVWWKCPKGPDHEWRTTVQSRAPKEWRKRIGRCPFCLNQRFSVTNSLAARFPKLARQWHPTRNGSLRPADLAARSELPVWWKCAVGHEWQSPPAKRIRTRASCPICRTRKRISKSVARAGLRVRLPARKGGRPAPVRRLT
jgi:hypothetical protein